MREFRYVQREVSEVRLAHRGGWEVRCGAVRCEYWIGLDWIGKGGLLMQQCTREVRCVVRGRGYLVVGESPGEERRGEERRGEWLDLIGMVDSVVIDVFLLGIC